MTGVCTCLGCHEPAEAVIKHPDHGRRVVCEDHADGKQEVLA